MIGNTSCASIACLHVKCIRLVRVAATALVATLLCGVLELSTAPAQAQDVAKPTAVCSDERGGDVLVERIQFYASNTDPRNFKMTELQLAKLTKKFKTKAEAWFNSRHLDGPGGAFRIKYEIGVRGADEPGDPSAHQIAVVNANNFRSSVDLTVAEDYEFGEQLSGRWTFDSLANADPRVGLHESGHLAGLLDYYQEKFVRDDGSTVDVPDLFQVLNGRVQAPEKWKLWGYRNGIDVATHPVSTFAKPGHESDLMARAKVATQLNPEHIAALRSHRSKCNLSIVRDVESARTCYSAPKKLPVRYQSFLPYTRIADAESALDRYPAAAGKSFPVQVGCGFKNEKRAILELLSWSDTWISRHAELESQLTAVDGLLTDESRQEIEKSVTQASMNATALANEAVYRTTVAQILIGRDSPGFGSINAKRNAKLAAEVWRFIREDLSKLNA